MKNKINQCTVTLTRNCNLRCDFCYAKQTKYTKNDEIEFDNLKKIVDFCDEAKIKYIVFTGGEPTTYSMLIDILKYIKCKDSVLMPTLATNGLLLSDLDFCKALIESGISYIDISLKGKNEKECYDTVGCDCFKQQMKAIRNLSDLNVDFTCSMVLTWSNIYGFCDAVKSACEYGAKQFSFTFVIDNEESKEKDLKYLEKYNPFSLVEAFISQINNINSITDDWWIEYSFPLCVYTEEQLVLLNGRLAAPCQIHKKYGITFDTKMNLLPCNMFIESKMGRFLSDFSTYNEFLSFLECDEYKQIIDVLNRLPSKDCANCKYLDLCCGGCPVIWKNYSYEALKKFKGIQKST